MSKVIVRSFRCSVFATNSRAEKDACLLQESAIGVSEHKDIVKAAITAKAFMSKGYAVNIYSHFIEADHETNKRFHREWWSFNGEDFKEERLYLFIPPKR